MVLGLISFLQLLGAERALGAIIFGGVALWQMSKDRNLSGRWMAVAGVALGIVYLLVLAINFPQILLLLQKLAGK
ncbi:MAG: hypothetical protein ACPL4K_05225 [Candidatus Margulisiibacteriota bacterium]